MYFAKNHGRLLKKTNQNYHYKKIKFPRVILTTLVVVNEHNLNVVYQRLSRSFTPTIRITLQRQEPSTQYTLPVPLRCSTMPAWKNLENAAIPLTI